MLEHNIKQSLDKVRRMINALEYSFDGMEEILDKFLKGIRDYDIAILLSKINSRRGAINHGLTREYEVTQILNELFVSSLNKRRVCVSDVGLATGIPLATAIRWQSVLVERNLIIRRPDVVDKRRVWLELTPLGRASVEAWLSEVKTLLAEIAVRTDSEMEIAAEVAPVS